MPPSTRYPAVVAVRVLGGVVDPDDENEVDARVVQLAADIGGDPADLEEVPGFTSVLGILAHWALPFCLSHAEMTLADGADAANLLRDEDFTYVNDTGDHYLVGHLHLPGGVVFDTVTVHGQVVVATGSIEVELWKKPHTGGAATQLGSTVTLSAGSPGAVSGAITFADQTATPGSWAYTLKVKLRDTGSAGSVGIRSAIASHS